MAGNTARLDRKMPQSRNCHLGIFQSSQATVLELWASPDLLGAPESLWSHPEMPQEHRKRLNLTPVASKTRPSEGFAGHLDLPSWNSTLLCTSSDYSQACQTSLAQLLQPKTTNNSKHHLIIPNILIFSFLDQNRTTEPPLDSSRRALSEKLDRVSSRRVWCPSRGVARSRPERREMSPSVLGSHLASVPRPFG